MGESMVPGKTLLTLIPSRAWFEYRDGSIRVPDAPGLGVRLDRDKLELYKELYKELGGYPYDRDPGGLDHYPLVPKQRFADPQVSLRPSLSTT
jgi:glucarate dehydratase